MLTNIDMAAQCRGTAAFDSIHDIQVLDGKGILLAILLSMSTKNVGHFYRCAPVVPGWIDGGFMLHGLPLWPLWIAR